MAFASSAAIKRLKSLAHSSQFNPRNLEALWYAPYSYTLHDLLTANGAQNVFVSPQGPLWMSEEENETALQRILRVKEDRDEGVQLHDPDAASDGDEWDDNVFALANVSISTEATVSGADAEGAPDFTFIHLGSLPMEVPAQRASQADKAFFRRRGGFQTAHQCFPGFLELKPSPSRQTKNRFQEQSAEFQKRLRQRREEAVKQLVKYCNIYTMRRSTRHPEHLPILLMAGTGAWWCYCLADCDTIPEWDFVANDDVIPQDIPRFQALVHKFSRFYELCRPDSDDMLNRLFDSHLVLFEDHSDAFNMEDDGDDLIGDDDGSDDPLLLTG